MYSLTSVRGFQPKLCAGFGVCPNTEGGRHKKSVIGNKKDRKGTGGSGDKSQRHAVPKDLMSTEKWVTLPGTTLYLLSSLPKGGGGGRHFW